MNERIVANNPQTLYAQYEGDAVMANADSKAGVSEGERRDHKSSRAKSTSSTTKASESQNPFLERVRSFFEIPVEENSLIRPTVPWEVGKRAAKREGEKVYTPATLSFNDASSFARTITSLRDADDRRKVKVVDDELAGMRKYLKEVGFEQEEILKMSDPEVIAAMQFALPKALIPLPKDSDFDHEKDPGIRRTEWALALEHMKKAKSADGDEELMTPEVIEGRAEFEDNGERSDHHDDAVANGRPPIVTPLGGPELVYETSLPLGKDGTIPVHVYRKDDGGHAMGKLPINKYDWQFIAKLLSETGISENPKKPNGWDKSSLQSKIDYLKKLGLDTLEGGDLLMQGVRAARGQRAQPQTVQEASFKQLLSESFGAGHGKAPIFPYDQIEGEILRRVHSDDPNDIYPAVRGLEEFRGSLGHDPALLNEFDLVLDPVLQNELYLAKEAIDDKYTILLDQWSAVGKKTLKDIDDDTMAALSSLKYGYSLEEVTEWLLNRATTENPDYPEPPGYEGIREWYAQRQVEKIRFVQEVEEISQIKADPFENIKSAERTMRFFERSESTQDLGIARQRLASLLNAVEESVDPDLRQEDKIRLRNEIDAWNIVTPLHITMNRREGDPRAVLEVAENLLDETVGHFYERFADVKDKDGRSYMVDVNGNKLKINFLGAGRNALTYKGEVEKYYMNVVSEITKADIGFNTVDPDIQNRINEFRDVVAEERQRNGLAPLNAVQMDAELQRRWSSDKGKIALIENWYKFKTVLGADGFVPNSPRTFRDVRMEEVFQTVLRGRLQTAGVAPDRINDLLGTLQNPNLLFNPDPNNPNYNPLVTSGDYDLVKAVRTIALNEETLHGFITVQDKLRVYNKEGEQIETVHNWENPDIAREIDHMPDYFLSEKHGDQRVNKVLRKHLDLKQKSWMIGSNSTEFRILSNIKNAGRLPPAMANKIENATVAQLAALGLPPDSERRIEVEAYVMLDLISKGYNPNALAGTEQFNKQLDIFNIEWGEASKAIDNYVLTDNMRDRESVLKMYREALREYQKRPTDANLLELIRKCYSSRLLRIEPFTELMLAVHWEVGQHWKEWLDLEENISNAQMDTLIERCIDDNFIGKKRGEKLKDKLTGSLIPRNIKQLEEFLGSSFKSTVLRPGYWGSSIWDFLRTLYNYLASRQ